MLMGRFGDALEELFSAGLMVCFLDGIIEGSVLSSMGTGLKERFPCRSRKTVVYADIDMLECFSGPNGAGERRRQTNGDVGSIWPT